MADDELGYGRRDGLADVLDALDGDRLKPD